MATTVTNAKVSSSRRSRIRYTNAQLKKLEDAFSQNHYPDSQTQDQLAAEFEMAVERIHIWFQNRRSKFKRESKTNHVMWMRKQIFETEDGQGALFPFGTPRLPALISSCHVLSPPETQQYGRRDAEWEIPPANLNFSVEVHQSPSIRQSQVLDLRKCSSPAESRISSTPKNIQASYQVRHCPYPSDDCYHSSKFSEVSLSPCRFSSPPPVSALPIMPRTFLPTVYAESFPGEMLSPIGFHGSRDLYDKCRSGSQSNYGCFDATRSDVTYSSCQFPWFSSPHLSTIISTDEESFTFGQGITITTENGITKTPERSLYAPGPSAVQSSYFSGSRASNKRKLDLLDVSEESTNDIKRMKSSASSVEKIVCGAHCGEESEKTKSEEKQENNSGSSLNVNLEDWC